MPDEKQNEQKSRTMPVLLVGGRYDGAKLDLAPYTQVIDIAPDKNVIVPDHMAAEREVESERYNIYPLQVPAVDYPLVFFMGVVEGQSMAWAVGNVMAFYAYKHAENEQENLH